MKNSHFLKVNPTSEKYILEKVALSFIFFSFISEEHFNHSNTVLLSIIIIIIIFLNLNYHQFGRLNRVFVTSSNYFETQQSTFSLQISRAMLLVTVCQLLAVVVMMVVWLEPTVYWCGVSQSGEASQATAPQSWGLPAASHPQPRV